MDSNRIKLEEIETLGEVINACVETIREAINDKQVLDAYDELQDAIAEKNKIVLSLKH